MLVWAMASDKDHKAFARSILSGGLHYSHCRKVSHPPLVPPSISNPLAGNLPLVAVVTTEVDVAGSRQRSTPAQHLLASWRQAEQSLDVPGCPVLEVTPLHAAIQVAVRHARGAGIARDALLVCVTGSLHAAGEALALAQGEGEVVEVGEGT